MHPQKTNFIFILIFFYTFAFAQYDWIKDPNNPLIIPDESKGIIAHNDPSLYYDGEKYHLWCTGGGFVKDNPTSGVRIYYFTSSDGETWLPEETNPVFFESSTGIWDSGHIETPHIIKAIDTYWMYYCATPDSMREEGALLKIGLAKSADGIHWARHPENPVLFRGNPGEWDERWIESPCVLKTDSLYYMWYTGVSTDWKIQVGLAVSDDGVHWTKHETNPVFSPSSKNLWESAGVYAPQVHWIDDNFVMLYTGVKFNNTGYDYSDTHVGLAISTDGIHWTRSSNQPVLNGTADAWDQSGPFNQDWIMVGDSLMMMYVSDQKIGKAKSAIQRTSVDQFDFSQPIGFQLLQNYPNPFNPETTIRYRLNRTCTVSLKIYNIKGQELETLIHGIQSEGEYQVLWNAGNLPGGIYLCQLQITGSSQTLKPPSSETKKLVYQK